MEPLEQRTLLSSTPVTGVAAQDNQAYVAGLIGSSQLGSPAQFGLYQKLTAELNAGVSRQQVVLNLLKSAPGRAAQVQTTYTSLLHRSPTPAQLRAGVALLQKAGDSRALVTAIAGSQAYLRVRGNGKNTGFLNALYQDVLQRAPMTSEMSAGLKVLGRRVSRTAFARYLVNSPAALTRLIQNTQAPLGPGAPGASAQELKALSRPGGLLPVTASVLASDALYNQIVNPAPVPTSPASVDAHPPGYPVAPGFDLTSGVQPLAVSTNLIDSSLNAISAGADDVPWLGTNAGLSTYNLNSGALTQVIASAPIASVSAINASEAYAIVSEPTAVIHVLKGGATNLPVIPNNETPVQISASADGVVWVLARSGDIDSYSGSTRSWSPVSTNGYTIKEISVGSSTNIFALTTSGGVLRYTAATGFQPYSNINSGISSVQATSDGALWVNDNGYIEMQPSSGTLAPVKVEPQLSFLDFAAGSMNRSFEVGFVSGSTNFTSQMDLISVGVVDRQSMPFPDYSNSPGQEQAYLDLSAAAHVNNPLGIRSLYSMPGQDWGGLQSDVQHATRPNDVSPSDFTTVQNELTTELLYLGEVYGRLALLKNLTLQIQIKNDAQLTQAATAVGLVTHGKDSDSTIRLVLEAIFEAVASSISSTGIPPAGAVVAALLASGFSSGISAYESQNMDSPGSAVKIAFNNLQNDLDSIFSGTLSALDTDFTIVANDLGKLTNVAEAILNGQWPYLNGTSDQIAAATTNAFAVHFYQVLTASMWQVEHMGYGDYITYPITQIIHVPSYDLYQMPDGYRDGVPYEQVYFVNQLGDTTDWNATNLGNFPGPTLTANIASLGGTAPTDFWTGQNGWGAIKHLEGTL